MRRTFLAAACALGLASLAVPHGVHAQDLVPGVADLSVAIESQPAVVSPPGELVLYDVEVSNGVVPTGGVVDVDLPDGAIYRDDLSDAACDTAGDGVRCAVSQLGPQERQSFDVVAHTPTQAGTYSTTATVAAGEPVSLVEYEPDNTASTDTEVKEQNNQVAAGLVEEGESLTLVVGDGREYTLTVPEGVPGVIVERLEAASGADKTCGTGPCGEGFLIQFVEDHPTFKALDPMNPLISRFTFGPQDPCRGVGTSSGCADVYFASDPADEVQRMENCPGAEGATAGDGTARPSPCVNQRYKANNLIYFDVRLLSNDPLKVPPLSLG